MVELLYGSGLRLHECLVLRIKDVDFALNTITVRQEKGDKDRVTLLPASLKKRLEAQVQIALAQHQQDLADGYNIRTIQKLLGHEDVTTTEIYTHVLGRGAMGVISPVDSE